MFWTGTRGSDVGGCSNDVNSVRSSEEVVVVDVLRGSNSSSLSSPKSNKSPSPFICPVVAELNTWTLGRTGFGGVGDDSEGMESYERENRN